MGPRHTPDPELSWRVADTPVFGRDELADELGGSINRGEHLLLTGGSGIGKTRLARALLEEIDRPVERVLASPATEGDRLGTLAAMGCPSGIAPHDVGALFQWYLGRWGSMARNRQPPILWVDDIHHVDELSAAVIRTAVTRNIVQLVATALTPMPRPADVDALHVEGALRKIHVPPLDRDASVELVMWASESPRSADDVAAICDLADGYPMYLRELARSSRPLDRRTNDLHVLIERQLRDLAPPDLRLARLIAAAEPLNLGLFGHETGSLHSLFDRGLIVHHGRDSVRVGHPLIATILREGVTEETYRTLAERAETSIVEVDPVSHALWWVKAGARPSPPLAQTATRAALARSDVAAAERLVVFCGLDRDRLEGQVLLALGRTDEAMAMLDAARHTARDPSHRIEAASVLARHHGLTLGDPATADRIMSEIETTGLGLSDRRTVFSARAWIWIFGHDVPMPDLEQARELMAQAPLDAAAHEIALDAACIAGFDGSPHRTAPFHQQRIALERDPSVEIAHEALVRGCCVHAVHLTAEGRPVAAWNALRTMLGHTRPDRVTDQAILGGNIAHYGSMIGQFGEARRAASAAVDAVAGIDWYQFGRLAALVLEGLDTLFETDPSADSLLGSDLTTFGVVFTMRARLFEVLRGDIEPDIGFEAWTNAFAASGRTVYPMLVACEALDLRAPPTYHEAIVRAVPNAVDGPMLQTTRDAAVARLARDQDGLLTAATSYEQMSFLPAAARAYADIVRLDGFTAVAAEARRGIVRCDLAAEALGHLATIASIDGLPTTREIAVAKTVLEHGSTAAAADHLSLARRTVENHLYRCCRALGLSGQAELAAAMQPNI